MVEVDCLESEGRVAARHVMEDVMVETNRFGLILLAALFVTLFHYMLGSF